MSFTFPPNTVILAEKASVAGDIAKVLGTATRQPGHFVVTGNILVTYAVGHLLDQGYPSDYDPALKQWRWETLPWLLESALHKPWEKIAQQLAVVGKLLKGAPLVVLVTDSGREGELIGWEILDWFKFRGKAMRLWLQATPAKYIRRSLTSQGVLAASSFSLYFTDSPAWKPERMAPSM